MSLREPVGHDAIRAGLKSAAAFAASGGSSQLHHAWLFAGPAGVGKFLTARWWASILKCPELGACGGTCASCRLVAGAVHPDVFETGPAPKDKNAVQSADEEIERKRLVGIDQSRALIQRLTLRPTRPGPRIAIMREAGMMTPEAQNALLKILEEPLGFAVIILVTDNPGAMLPTVRSRCRHLVFGTLSEDEVAAVLVDLGRSEAEARTAAACSHGSVARALDYDDEGLAGRELVLLAYEAARRDPLAIEPLVHALVERKESGYAMSDILEWQLAKVRASLGRRPPEPSEPLGRALDEAAAADPAVLIGEAETIERTIVALSRNANARLVIRDLLLNVRAFRL
ncbi:MAG TPA: hypothetical protein VGK20_18535 [Candidatus Binatia bacterium]